MPERAASLSPDPPTHPLLTQRGLELRARIRRLRRTPAQGGFVLLAWIGLAALLTLALRGPLRDALTQAAALALAWPWLSAVIVMLWMTRALGASARRFERERSHGWLAALPCPLALQRRGRRRWLALPALGMALVSTGVLLAALFDAPLAPTSRLALIVSPLPCAAIAWLWVGLRRARIGGAEDEATRILASRPRRRLLLMPPRGPLPELADWQQREAQRGWRRGRGGLWLLALWLLIPAGEAGPVLLVLALLGAALAAMRAVMAASVNVVDRADALLSASPRRRADFATSSLPYPTSRLLAMAVLALLLVTPLAGAWTGLGAALSVILLGLLELAIAIRFPRRPARRRTRLAIELIALALLARHGLAPLLPLLLPVLIVWHLRQACR